MKLTWLPSQHDCIKVMASSAMADFSLQAANSGLRTSATLLRAAATCLKPLSHVSHEPSEASVANQIKLTSHQPLQCGAKNGLGTVHGRMQSGKGKAFQRALEKMRKDLL